MPSSSCNILTLTGANLATATLFRTEHEALPGKPLSKFVAAQHLNQCYAMRRRLIVPELTESMGLLLMQPLAGEPFWFRQEIVTRFDPTDDKLFWQVAISSIEASLGPEPEASPKAKEAICGIAREALQNVVRHANATDLSVRLARSDEVLYLEVLDNGSSFAPETVGTHTMGLRSMRERAAEADGSLELISAPGAGTQMHARIPAGEG